jgi:hypothetical protein
VNLIVREGRSLASLSLSRQDDSLQKRERTEEDDGLDGESHIAGDHADYEADGEDRPLDTSPQAARFLKRLSPTNRRASSGLYSVSPRLSARCIRRFRSARFHSAAHSGRARRSAATSRWYLTTAIAGKSSMKRRRITHAMVDWLFPSALLC